jgi:hypothetical protein
VLIKALTGGGAKTARSHFIFEKGGKLVDKKIPVKPADRYAMSRQRTDYGPHPTSAAPNSRLNLSKGWTKMLTQWLWTL